MIVDVVYINNFERIITYMFISKKSLDKKIKEAQKAAVTEVERTRDLQDAFDNVYREIDKTKESIDLRLFDIETKLADLSEKINVKK